MDNGWEDIEENDRRTGDEKRDARIMKVRHLERDRVRVTIMTMVRFSCTFLFFPA